MAGRKTRITATGKAGTDRICSNGTKGSGVSPAQFRIHTNVAIGMFQDPGMIQPGVVGYKIKDQAHPTLVQRLTSFPQVTPVSDERVGLISLNRVG